MAASTSSSSSCQTAESKYDVFLSFRGEDTRENFTSHLFAALCRKKTKTFIDEDLKRGDEISPALLNAIEGSKISVIILSKDYASSKWCLDELVKILECKKKNGQIVIPVFYHVHPSDVRKQTRSFSEAFVKHEIFFKNMPGKVQKWRAALTEASYLAGHESLKIRPEAKLVDVIVKDILKKLENLTVSTDSKGLIGISSQIERVKSLLCIGLQNFRILGIWGMGGIGKTTLAEAIFKQVSCDFEGNCFMANVREKTEKGGGLEHLQREVLSHLLEENLEKGGPNLPEYIKKRLQRMKVFIVLDDVNSLGQLEYLAGGLQFALGSRIIITTRDKEVLDKFRVDNIYKVEKLDDSEALELFRDYAFRQNHCPEDLTVLLEQVVDYARGNPLALKVLGSYFHGKSKPDWEKALHNFHRISSPKIFGVLKISYDELNLEEKSLFLDIACFFNGEDKERVIEILDDPSMSYGLNTLIDKSLVTVSQKYTLQMHDLLQEMGQEIVRQESVKELGRRSRLWYHEDVYHLLKKNKGTDKIEGIFLDMSKIGDLHLTSGAFAKMSNLRLLKFFIPEHFGVSHMSCNVHLSEGLKYLPDELRYLYWHGYPLRTLPLNFNPENLIELSLPCSKVQQLWEGKREAPKLKSIDLRHSHCLASIPDPSETPNVERINLLNCINLSCIPSSIQNFNNLALLCFTGCTSLSCFPTNIHFRSPIKINFFSCINLTEFPPISGNIIELDLRDTAIKEVSSSIKNLTNLENLNLSHCKKLTSLSTSICKLKSLRMLDLSWCSNFKSFPEILEEMESLECISLVSTKIKELPSSIELLKRLTELRLSSCSKLDSLPENLGNLKSLKLIDGEHTAVSQLPSSITNLNKLEKVTFNGCRGLILPSLSGLSNLKEMRLNGCGIIEIPQDIGCLSTLEILDLKGNNFENLPTSIGNFLS